MHRNSIRIHWFFTLALLLLTVGLVGCRSASRNDKVVEKIEPKNKALKVVEALHDPNSQYVVVVSHRGDWRNYPENSIPAIESVIRMGVDMMELDLKMTKDNVLVLCHDGTLDRTTTGHGPVSDYTYEELLQFDLKRGHGIAIPGLKIPTLRQALEVCKDRITVNVDQGYEYYDQVLEIADELGVTDQLLIKGGHLWPEVQAKLAEHPHNLMYMPVVTLNGSEWSHTLFESYIISEEPQMAYEICFDELNDEVRETINRVLDTVRKFGSTRFGPRSAAVTTMTAPTTVVTLPRFTIPFLI